MKIHRLTFKNINSLRGQHAIDFDQLPLRNAGLFAITGPTGAGKTTLLDVISLAIYNRIPRLGSAISKGLIQKTGLILTENTSEAWAEVEFSGRRGRYISRWSIAKARTGSLKDHEMEVFDCQAQQLIDLKKSEVPGKNEQLIGLNYDQFIRSMLLAQGEFARFLKSDKNERGKLLEKITGSEIYRLIGRKAFEKNKEFGQELERLLDRERGLVTERMEEEAYTALVKEVEDCDGRLASANAELRHWQSKMQDKQRFLKLGEEVKECEEAEKRAGEQWQAFEEERGEALSKHEELLPQAESLTAWQQSAKRLTQLDAQAEDWQQREAAAHQAIAEAHSKLGQVVGSDVPAEDQLYALETLESRVGELEDARKAARVSYSEASKRGQALATKLDINFSSQEPTEGRRLALEAQKALQINHVKAAAILPEAWMEDLDAGQAELQGLVAKGQRWKEGAQAIERIRVGIEKKRKSLGQLQERKGPLPKAIKELDHQVEVLELKVSGLRKDLVIQQQSAQLEDYRAKLVEGEPCPLCGAEHHPYATQMPPENQGLEHEIERQEKALRQTDRARAEQRQALAQIEERLGELEQEIEAETKELAATEVQVSELIAGLANDWQEYTWDSFQAELQAQGEALKQVV
ncbi:MAG: AAA family ATPase, partial [Bacteroidota bacterium]